MRCLTSFVFLFVVSQLFSAPAPFQRKKELTLTPSSVMGEWDVVWGGCSYKMAFAPDGYYSASPGGWTGSWKVVDFRLSITESCCPQESDSWTLYVIKLNPHTLKGPIEVGAIGIEVSLIKRK